MTISLFQLKLVSVIKHRMLYSIKRLLFVLHNAQAQACVLAHRLQRFVRLR